MKDPSSGERATQARYNLMQMAAGMKDVVRLGAGDPDLPTPPEIIGEAIHRMSQKEGSISTRGLDGLRRALAEHYKDEKGLDYDPDSEILITNGAQEGLFLTLLALVNPGDGVLVQDPRYSSYDQAVEAAGGTIIQVPTGRDYNFALEPDDLKEQARNGKLLVFVNPNNPTASLVPAPTVREIAAVAREEGLFVISDEVYDKLVFDDVEVVSVAECEGMREQTVILSSVSKTYAMTGFRVGYLLGPKWFIDAAARLKKVISGRSPLFSQYAALSALTGSQVSRQQILGIFTARRKAMMEGLDSLGIRYGHPGAGFFIWADISRFAVPADEFCRRLLLEARVLMFPGTSFGERWKDYVRISILEPVERIAEGIERMRAFAESARLR
jgi:aspartate/methionine/tyrosine aminotransferase